MKFCDPNFTLLLMGKASLEFKSRNVLKEESGNGMGKCSNEGRWSG